MGTLFHGVLARRTTLLWIGFFCQYASFYFANTWTPKLLSDATQDATLGVRAGVLVSTSGILPTSTFPQFKSWASSRWIKPGGPFEPHTGTQYVYSQIADVTYKRLTRQVQLPATGGTLSSWTSPRSLTSTQA